ncbi:Transposon TX1 uncharacterized 149 kDa protein, partial [Linum perenne]
EICWHQKAKENWLRLGDRNTNFFHRVANVKRRWNNIASILVNGSTIEGQSELKQAAVAFYSSLYSDPLPIRPFPELLLFSAIPFEDSVLLEAPFDHDEIWQVVKGCAGNKSPGPDGFTLEFFKSNWDVIKEDLCAALSQFAADSFLPPGINSTFVALIPKNEAVEEFRDLRPISLVGGVYKILSKLLAGRLKNCMSKVISEQQCAFVGG